MNRVAAGSKAPAWRNVQRRLGVKLAVSPTKYPPALAAASLASMSHLSRYIAEIPTSVLTLPTSKNLSKLSGTRYRKLLGLASSSAPKALIGPLVSIRRLARAIPDVVFSIRYLGRAFTSA